MGSLWSSFHYWLKKRRLFKKRILLEKELNSRLEELHILGVINKNLENYTAPLESKVCNVLCVRTDCVILSGGLRLEVDPLLHLKEGDSVLAEKKSIYHSWKVTAVNTMDILMKPVQEVSQEIDIIDLTGDDQDEQPNPKILDGRVVAISNGNLILHPEGYNARLSAIHCTFDPVAGDIIDITATNNDSKIEVTEIRPKKTKYIEGIISHWGGSFGHITEPATGDVATFRITECEVNYLPRDGDKVLAVILQNNATDGVAYRALKVALMQLANSGGIFDPEVDELLQDTDEIKIAKHFDCGSLPIGAKGRILPTITNNSGRTRYLTGVYPCVKVSPTPQFKLVSLYIFPVKIEHGQTITLIFDCEPEQEGSWRDLFVFDFERGKFQLGRFFSVEVTSENRMRDSYKKPKFVPHESLKGPVIKSQHKMNLNPFRRRVKKNLLPDIVKKLVEGLADSGKDEILVALQKNYPYLMEEVNTYNYTRRFALLLHLEEAESERGMDKWRLNNIVVERDLENCESLSVPAWHLTERRPSVLSGDIVQVQNCKGGPVFEGTVNGTWQGRIKFKLHSAFPYSSCNELYNVNFTVSRTNFKFMHTAIEAAWKSLGDEVLFPASVEMEEPQIKAEKLVKLDISCPGNENNLASSKIKTSSGGWFNPNLNTSQRSAVKNILLGTARPMPYVIFGPPGTGKTITLVEAILQIYKQVPYAKILVATPSNSAADLITELLISVKSIKPGILSRLVAYNYSRSVPTYLQDYVLTISDGNTNIEAALEKNKITVGTCTAVGKLCLLKKLQYYTHVMVDEAGQASEPETMCAVALMGKPRQIVLAGDPKQLGPVITGRIAVQGGLDISWLSRILQTRLYSRHPGKFSSTEGYNPCLITMLTMNYRTVPEILAVPSKLFYDDLLVPMVSQSQGKEAQLLHSIAEELPIGRNGPPALVFHGLRGKCCRDNDSPSWFNPLEVSQVFAYVRKLMSKNVKSWDIGIITFYAKQTAKMKDMLFSNGIHDVKVGSVEEFQGQERMVIILSTVRAMAIEDDSMGFISSPNRINVALTRAKALLIVVGDPHMLISDYNWKTVLMDCVKRNAYTGCDLPFALSSRPQLPHYGQISSKDFSW